MRKRWRLVFPACADLYTKVTVLGSYGFAASTKELTKGGGGVVEVSSAKVVDMSQLEDFLQKLAKSGVEVTEIKKTGVKK